MRTVVPAAHTGPGAALRPSQAWLGLPVALAFALSSFLWLPAARENTRLALSLLAAAVGLGSFAGGVWWLARGRTLRVEVQLRAQHYLQACAQGTVLAYWGWYWPPVYEALPLIAAQLVFAYAFDMLLAWARRDTYTLGFAPFPVIFSTNLFLWFKSDWFFLQFLMIAVGFAAKDLIRWDRDGRRVHIFNPSSFPLALFSLGLIVTGATSITWGEEIATTQFNPPNIYVLLFLVGLPGQFLFGVTTMTMSAVVSTYLFGLAFFWATGTYYFIDSYIPVAVFLGMHLLFTDPSTAPKSEVGRIVFGIIYGLSNVALYAAFGAIGIPKFYDKLLPVPLMNLSVRAIDRLAPRLLRWMDPARLAPRQIGRKRHLAYISIWVAIFAGMHSTDAVGDHHPGHRVSFWLNACQQDNLDACQTLDSIVTKYCADGSGWACNERGRLRWSGKLQAADKTAADFQQACTLGFVLGCQNAVAANNGLPPSLRFPSPQPNDYPVILRTGKGDLPDQAPLGLFTLACEQGFPSGCHSLGALYLQGRGVPKDPLRAAARFVEACSNGWAAACSDLALMHYRGDGIPLDRDKGIAYLGDACKLGMPGACERLTDIKRQQQQAGEGEVR